MFAKSVFSLYVTDIAINIILSRNQSSVVVVVSYDSFSQSLGSFFFSPQILLFSRLFNPLKPPKLSFFLSNFFLFSFLWSRNI